MRNDSDSVLQAGEVSRLVKKDNEVKKPTKLYCEVCRKSFGSKNSFDQHERSKRHLQGLKKMQEEFQNAPAPESPAGAEAVVEEVEEKEKVTTGYTEPFTPEEYSFEPCRCLFCRKDSDSFDAYNACGCIYMQKPRTHGDSPLLLHP